MGNALSVATEIVDASKEGREPKVGTGALLLLAEEIILREDERGSVKLCSKCALEPEG